jgi:predicted dehydrogenase
VIRRGAIIGCGFFARHHIEAWRRIPGVQIVAACDLDLGRARTVSDRVYDSAKTLFTEERLDFVDIVTQADSHLSLASLAAMHRVPVICQKPIAPDWQSAVELVKIMEQTATPFMVHENWRWQPWYRVIRKLIESGEIGCPLNYAFRSRHNDGRGEQPYPLQAYFRTLPRLLIYETLIHHLDTARFLFGEIQSVYADTDRRNPNIEGEDRAIICVNHEQGVRGWIDGHRFLDPAPGGPAMGEAFFEGEEGLLLLLANGDIYKNGVLVWENKVTSGYRGDSVLATQAHFVFCLDTGQPFESSGREHLKTTAAMEACYMSAREHCRVNLSRILNMQLNHETAEAKWTF